MTKEGCFVNVSCSTKESPVSSGSIGSMLIMFG